MRLMKSILLAGAMAVAGAAASASTMQLTYSLAHGQNVTIDTAPDGVFKGGVWAGAFRMTDVAGTYEDFLAFCLDATSAILPTGYYTETDNPFAIPATIAPGRLADLTALFATGYQSVVEAIETAASNRNLLAAAFQVSAWEILYETEDYAAGSGAFAISNTKVIKEANKFLNNLAGDATGNWELTFLQKSDQHGNPSTAGQNLVTATPSAIPLPAAGWLLLGGLAALGTAARRRRAA
jgi:hypothetical protein